MVNIDSKLLEALQSSTCFGLAYEESVPECKQCDVKSQCKAKSEGGNIPTPIMKTQPAKTSTSVETTKTTTKKETKTTKPKATPTKKTTKSVDKKPVATPGNMPDFKPMSLEDLISLAKERDVEWKDYGNDNITRMRLIMVLKKSYVQ